MSLTISNNPPLRQAAVEAAKPRVRCTGGKSCSCDEYPRRMAKFHELGPPQAIITLFEMIDYEQALNAKLREDAVPAYTCCSMCSEPDCCDGEWNDGSERCCLHCGELGELTSYDHKSGHTFWVLHGLEEPDEELEDV